MQIGMMRRKSGAESGDTHSRPTPADALVIFGVTGDLAHKMIFPALYAMAKRGVLNVPVVGVATSKWSQAQLRKQATDSIKQAAKTADREALDHLLSLLRYVDGDYNDLGTFKALKQTLGDARRTTSPSHPRCSPRLSKVSGLRAWRIRRASSVKSRSDATWLRRGSSTASRCRCSRKTRSSASTTISGRRRS